MNRIICLTLALCLLLCACGSKPAGTTAPPETVPVETTAPIETTAPVETTSPTETAAPVETTVPPETEPSAKPTEPAEDDSYTIRIEDPETLIYAGPALRTGSVTMVGEAGVYTIVEEVHDDDGNLWGRLKSGIGWLCLTEPVLAPIYADYAPEDFSAYHSYWSEESDYFTSIGFTPTQRLTDVHFTMLIWDERGEYQVDKELYTMESLDPEHTFLAQVTFWGDMTTYGISFTDAAGQVRCYALMISGKDGSLVCTEYEP